MTYPDVLIVGGGLAGLSVAWHLAPHRRVRVLEQGRQPGAEASAQNAGMVRRMGEDPYERALAIRTAARLETLDWSTLPSRKTGAVLALGQDPHHLRDAVAHLRAAGVAVHAASRELVAEVPILSGSPLRAAWYLPDEHVADAWSLVQGFVAGLRAHGGELRLGVTVHGLLTEGDRVVGVKTSRGELRAGAVVLAAGAWSAELARTAGLERPLMPVRRALLHGGPHPLSRPTHPWVWVDDVGVYARPEGDGWLVSACDEAVDWPTAPESRGPVTEEQRARASGKVAQWFPPLAGLRLSTGWTGLRTFAPDRRPVLGEDAARPGLWWAAGLGGYGVTCSLGVGEAVAAWLCGEDLAWIDRRGVAPHRRYDRKWAVRPTGDLHNTRLVPSELPPVRRPS